MPFAMLSSSRRVNKSPNSAYNKGVEEITVSEQGGHALYISYLYNTLAPALTRQGGGGELSLSRERAVLKLRFRKEGELRSELKERITEIVGIGYKYVFLHDKLHVALSRREKKLLLAALIAADYEGDKGYIRRKVGDSENYNIDGIYTFRLGAMREKWLRIAEYVPEGFTSGDLKQFCDFLVGESRNKIYLKGNTVFGENFTPLRRSRLTGEEDAETEILLSDAGFVYCLGAVEPPLCEFLQKFYAERAIFS